MTQTQFLGLNYDRDSVTQRKVEALKDIEEAKRRRRKTVSDEGHQNSVPLKVRSEDPLIAQLEEILDQVDSLFEEAQAYAHEHINQTYRRVNAECSRLQVTLDGIRTVDREDARQLKKKAIVTAERAAGLMCSKIHRYDHTTCPNCLQI